MNIVKISPRIITDFDTNAENVTIDIEPSLGGMYSSGVIYRVTKANEEVPSNVVQPSAIEEWPNLSYGDTQADGFGWTIMIDYKEISTGKWEVHFGYGTYNSNNGMVTQNTARDMYDDLVSVHNLWKSYNVASFIETARSDEEEEVIATGLSTDLHTSVFSSGLNAVVLPSANLNQFTSYFSDRIEILQMSTELIDSTVVVILVFNLLAINYSSLSEEGVTDPDGGWDFNFVPPTDPEERKK